MCYRVTTPTTSRGKITRDAMLVAALDIIDRDGAGTLSRRRLARALGRDPNRRQVSGDRHGWIPRRAALLVRVVDRILGAHSCSRAARFITYSDPSGLSAAVTSGGGWVGGAAAGSLTVLPVPSPCWA